LDYHYEPMNAAELTVLANDRLEKYRFFGMIAATS
jgi:hypothetical protein